MYFKLLGSVQHVIYKQWEKIFLTSLAIGLTTAQFTFPANTEAKTVKSKDPFTISAPSVDYKKGIKASVTVTPGKGNKGLETVVFQLINGTTPVTQTAVETDIKKAEKFTVSFNASNPEYWVKVSVVSKYNGNFKNFGSSLAKPVNNAPVTLRIMETTDVHTNLLGYDYYKDAVSDTVGFAKTATLIKEARKEVKNSVLVDNGDLIQGTPLGTYKATVEPLKKEKFILFIRL